jgi:hypothetical protein
VSAFLQRLAARSLSALPVLEPRRAARFEPAAAPVAPETPMLAGPASTSQSPEPGLVVPSHAATAQDEAPKPTAPGPRPNPSLAPAVSRASAKSPAAEAAPVVVIHHHEAPLLVAEPILPTHETSASPAPVAAPRPAPPLLESRPAPQLLARLPQAPPAVRQGPRGSAAGPLAATLPGREDIHISIGRIEIKATPAAGGAPKARPAVNGAPSGLDTYLQQRGRRTP